MTLALERGGIGSLRPKWDDCREMVSFLEFMPEAFTQEKITYWYAFTIEKFCLTANSTST
jgi:hypothetical protein